MKATWAGANGPRGRLFDFCPWRFAEEASPDEQRRQGAWQAALAECGEVRFGRDCFVSPLAGVFPERLLLGEHSYIAAYAYVTGELVTGSHCTVNPYAVVRGRVTLGEGVRVGAHASVLGFNHGFADVTEPVYRQAISSKGIALDDDVWVGSNALILDGVRVGAHSVVAAGAVVTKDVPAYAVVGGNPARVLRSRLPGARAPHVQESLTARLAAFGERVRSQWREVLARCAEAGAVGPRYLPAPGEAPSVRALCDAVEIAAMFGEAPPLEPPGGWVATLQGFQDPTTGLVPDPWQPSREDAPAPLSERLERYHLLAVGYALELLGAGLRYPVHALEQLSVERLYETLDALPWKGRAWRAGDWIDAYATGLYLNAKHFGAGRTPEPLFGWLLTHADPFTGMWGRPRLEDGWLQPVNGFYRLTRGSYAQFGMPLPYPERTLDTVLAHARDPRCFGDEVGDACNVLDVAHPLWLCGLQTSYRRAEAQAWARDQLMRALRGWGDDEGFSFDLKLHGRPAGRPSLQGTEMWLAIVYVLAEIFGESEALGYRPEGVHHLRPRWVFNAPRSTWGPPQ